MSVVASVLSSAPRRAVATVTPECRLAEGLEQLASADTRHLVVCDAGRPVGWVPAGLLSARAAQRLRVVSGDAPVGEWMLPPPPLLELSLPVEDAEARLQAAAAGVAAVVDAGGRLRGVLERPELSRARELEPARGGLDLVDRADAALYRAKEAGRNCVEQ